VKIVRGEVRALTGCPQFVAVGPFRNTVVPDLLPGLPDPLPVPELEKIPKGWANRPDVKARHIAAFKRLLAADIPPPDKAEGSGIVICGGGKYWPMLTAAVRMCRDQTDLLIQIWHRGASEPVQAADLADLEGISIIDATAYPCRVLKGWEIKSLALLHCGFERVLYIDADAYLVGDPRPLFALAVPERPFVFWQDMVGADGAVRWEMTGVPPDIGQAMPCVQGGQLLYHRSSAWRELVLFHWLNQHSDYFYATGFGDQDTHRVAFAATQRGYHCLGRAPWRAPAFVCWWNGKPVIIHRCRNKAYSIEDRKHFAAHLPGEARFWEYMQMQADGPRADAGKVFTRVYSSGLWGHGTGSGGGSTQAEAAPYLEIVNDLIAANGWTSVLDLGCGDGAVTSGLHAHCVTGVDVYSPHLDRLRGEYPLIRWIRADLDKHRELLPAADVWLVKDVCQHWPSSLIREWLEWAKASGKAKAIVVTNDRVQTQSDCHLGGYRGLDLEQEPLASLGLTKVADYLHKSTLIWRAKG
jgi:hypothetical protein